MTNLEYYKDELKEIENEVNSCFIPIIIGKTFNNFVLKHLDEIDFQGDAKLFFDWLLEERKKKIIKLTEFEYDIVASYYCNQSITNHNQRLNDYTIFGRLKKTGKYFKDLDLSMTIRELYERCEVVK